MANWNLPTVDSNYITFVDEVNNRDVDSALMFDGTGTNLPNLTIRWNQSNNRFERLEDGTWRGRTIGVAGGGTGATTAAGARSKLNLGSMATQDSNAVGVNGGSITGVSFSGTGTLSGNASTASKWQTARTLKIGATGKSVNGGANVTWSADEIGSKSATANTVAVRNSSGNLYANAFYGNGANLTALNASNLTTGMVPEERLGISTSVEVDGSGDFVSGTIYLYKIGRLVLLSHNVLQHDEKHTPVSATGLIPPEYRPATFQTSSNATGAIAHNVSTLQSPPNNTVSQIFVTDTGQFSCNHKNLDTGLNRSTSVLWTGNIMYLAAS